jgi:hypothetical protein
MSAVLFRVLSVLVLLTLCYVYLLPNLSPYYSVFVVSHAALITTLEASPDVSFCNITSRGTNLIQLAKNLVRGTVRRGERNVDTYGCVSHVWLRMISCVRDEFIFLYSTVTVHIATACTMCVPILERRMVYCSTIKHAHKVIPLILRKHRSHIVKSVLAFL